MSDVSLKSAKTGFYPVYKFMERELGLRCNDLRVYALLFSYTCGSAGMYFGSRKYFAQSLTISVRTLHRALTRLFERGLIENAVDKESQKSGIRCTFIHENEKSAAVGRVRCDGGFVFTEEQKTRAIDNLVRETYGELPEKLHLAARAAVRDNLERKARQRQIDEAARRITQNAKL